MNKTQKVLDFIVIGASKSGTTALYHYLRQHPEIYLPVGKNVPFFTSDQWFGRGWNSVAAELFAEAKKDAFWGSVAPGYMEDSRVPSRIFDLMPATKLIAVLRNPVDRTFSHYRQQIRHGKEQEDFAKYISAQLEPESLNKARGLLSQAKTISLCHPLRSEYVRILEQFLSYFPKEQLLILFTEDMELHPERVLRSIFEFIGADPTFVPSNVGKRYHVGGTRERFPWIKPLARKIYPVRLLWKSLPISRRRGILTTFNTEINVVSEASPQIPPDVRKRLVDFYRMDVKKMETLIGRKAPWDEFHESLP